VSLSDSLCLPTKANVTAPLNALDTLAMRTVSSAVGGCEDATSPVPATMTWTAGPTCTMATAPGGPPGIVTNLCSKAEKASRVLTCAFVAAGAGGGADGGHTLSSGDA